MQTFYKNLILHIPHSSASMPLCYFQNQSEDNPQRDALFERSKDLIDWYTDELFASGESNPQVHPAIFPLCRTLCDVERLPEDPLEAKNLGILYFGEDERINHYGLTKESSAILRQTYQQWQNNLADMISSLESPLLIDCHSFSSFSTGLCEIDYDKPVDICIGFNDDESKPDDAFIGFVADYFKGCGYRVGINVPFSNSKTFDSNKPYHSLMIEINKSLYMDESNLEKTNNYNQLHNEIVKLYTHLLA